MLYFDFDPNSLVEQNIKTFLSVYPKFQAFDNLQHFW